MERKMSNESPTEISPFPEAETSQAAETTKSKQVLKTSKMAVADVLSTLKFVWQDPGQGLQNAVASLGDTRSFYAGIVLCLAFVLVCWAGVQKVFGLLSGFLGFWSFGLSSGYGGGLGVAEHFRILLSAAIPVLGMVGILWGIKKLFKGAGNYQQFTLMTGVVLTPITGFLFLLWLLGNSSVELISLVGLFSLTTFVLLLYTELFSLLRLSSRNALLLVPTLLVTDLILMKIMFEILY
jgi:hypothetical protein